jgi:hypothetical protein
MKLNFSHCLRLPDPPSNPTSRGGKKTKTKNRTTKLNQTEPKKTES